MCRNGCSNPRLEKRLFYGACPVSHTSTSWWRIPASAEWAPCDVTPQGRLHRAAQTPPAHSWSWSTCCNIQLDFLLMYRSSALFVLFLPQRSAYRSVAMGYLRERWAYWNRVMFFEILKSTSLYIMTITNSALQLKTPVVSCYLWDVVCVWVCVCFWCCEMMCE